MAYENHRQVTGIPVSHTAHPGTHMGQGFPPHGLPLWVNAAKMREFFCQSRRLLASSQPVGLIGHPLVQVQIDGYRQAGFPGNDLRSLQSAGIRGRNDLVGLQQTGIFGGKFRLANSFGGKGRKGAAKPEKTMCLQLRIVGLSMSNQINERHIVIVSCSS